MQNTYSIDLNADVGEGMNNEEYLLPFLSSCNIACGYHAGSIKEMEYIVELAMKHGVSIGAHPSYPDRENFGRLPMNLGDQELKELISEQLKSIEEVTKRKKTELKYVKPHGALYHKIAHDPHTAEIFIKTMQSINPKLYLLGFAGSEMERIAGLLKCPFVSEAFADRAYDSDGQLVSRARANAVHDDIEKVWNQVYQLITEKKIIMKDFELTIDAKSICFHGDTPESVVLLKETYELLIENGVTINPFC